MIMIKKIAEFFLLTYFFIASASACLVLTTYFLLDRAVKINALTAFVFFSTLLFYNFHRVSSYFDGDSFSPAGITKQLKEFSTLTKSMLAISTVGIIISAALMQVKTLLIVVPLGLITFSYSVPLLKLKGRKKRLREIFLIKIISLAFTWSLITVTLPMVDTGVSVFSSSSLFLFTERFLFMFAICIPFEIRDLEQEKKWGNMTLPQRIGITWSKIAGLQALLMFLILVYIQFGNAGGSKTFVTLSQGITAIVAALLLVFTNQTRSNYYFRIFVDGTMQLQFILLLLFNHSG